MSPDYRGMNSWMMQQSKFSIAVSFFMILLGQRNDWNGESAGEFIG